MMNVSKNITVTRRNNMKIGDFNWLIGADPEVFIRSKITGKLVSAHGMLPGTKEEPFLVPHGAVQVDGMAAEFNIDPAKNANEFVRNVKSVMHTLNNMIGKDYEIAVLPTAHFGKEMIDAQPDEAKILGCDPDYSAYTSRQNNAPDIDTPFRTAAGHIHIGWTEGAEAMSKPHLDMCEHLIKTLDYYTTPMVRLEHDVLRRKLYGMAGSYRPKSYGVEYRTPSCVWLLNEKTMRLMFKMIRRGIEACVHGKLPHTDTVDAYTVRAIYRDGRDKLARGQKRMVCEVLEHIVKGVIPEPKRDMWGDIYV
jgi:hypothetical protein